MKYAGLLAGLGNPGKKYENTRHNCGFMLVDLLLGQAWEEGEAEELPGKKFNALLWRLRMPGLEGDWLAAKPQTFMNDSGAAIKPLLAWHDIPPARLLVAHDELDLPPGSIRFKSGGGLAGHNGLLSISGQLGTNNFNRLRIGIGKPAGREEMIGWVLGRPAPGDREKIGRILPEGLETFLVFSREGAEAAAQFARDATRANI